MCGWVGELFGSHEGPGLSITPLGRVVLCAIYEVFAPSVGTNRTRVTSFAVIACNKSATSVIVLLLLLSSLSLLLIIIITIILKRRRPPTKVYSLRRLRLIKLKRLLNWPYIFSTENIGIWYTTSAVFLIQPRHGFISGAAENMCYCKRRTRRN